MPCYRSHDANGDFVGILCGKLGPACVQCGDVSAALCDFAIGDEQRTCDRPLCLRCAPTIGADKNYCAEHAVLGPGVLLFKPRRLTEAEIQVQALAVIREQQAAEARRPARRLPKKPPAGLEWCVARDGARVSPWMSETAARRFRYRAGGDVRSWDQFVADWRRRYPLKRTIRAAEFAVDWWVQFLAAWHSIGIAVHRSAFPLEVLPKDPA